MPPTTQPQDLLSLTKGIDVSHWQGNIDWKAVAADGIRFTLWIANYGVKAPSIPKGWGDWTFWQDTEIGFVKGVEGRVDHNQCRDLNAVERIGCPSMPPAIVSLPA